MSRIQKVFKQLGISAVLLCLCVFGAGAQDYPTTFSEGPAVRTDSLSLKPLPSFHLSTPSFLPIRQPNLLFSPSGMETKEQRAAKINFQTYNAVTTSVDRNLYWNRPPKIQKPWKPVLGIAKLFLSNPFGFPEGCVPLMNHSFPFIYARTPGMAPYDKPYASDMFPKCIDIEYDYATGTYRQVMVDWSEIQKRRSASGIGQYFQAVPSVPVTPVERMMY